MFDFICGEIVEIGEGYVVLKNNGIGFCLTVSQNTLANCSRGKEVQLFCYLQVREDGWTLYGFSTKTEKNMFLQLISVSGVGCKVAIAILSATTPEVLANAIVSGNTTSLCSIKGLGKKTSERLILELREKVSAFCKDIQAKQLSPEQKNALAVLVSLGCSQADATERVKVAYENGATTVQEIINASLRMN
ncbi:MAG: Holliday junction branch migration protein RuvA [Clostridia bacterium]|nr:Holliday junction branch migration protein RuvA [Clostridia bacterium]